jgi:uncharacterized protein (TIGR02246 family)
MASSDNKGFEMTVNNQENQVIKELQALLSDYERALNAADVETIVNLYQREGVFMAQHRMPSVGQQAIRQAYTQIFEQIRLHVRFELDEIVPISDTLAYARTRSVGQTSLVGKNVTFAEGNQELFLLARVQPGEAWKISRYIFATTNPPTQP